MIKISSLFSGSGGNAFVVSSGKTHILVDAGYSLRRISAALADAGLGFDDVSAVLITHEHADHAKSLCAIAKKYDVPIHLTVGTARAAITEPLPKADNVFVYDGGFSIDIGDILVTSFPVPHDAAEPVGFVFESGGVRVGFATDTGCVTNVMRASLSGCDGVVIESNHDERLLMYGPYPHRLKVRILSDDGHLSNDGAAELAAFLEKTGTRSFMLAHLSQTNNTPEFAVKTVRDAVGNGVEVIAASPDALTEMTVERSAP